MAGRLWAWRWWVLTNGALGLLLGAVACPLSIGALMLTSPVYGLAQAMVLVALYVRQDRLAFGLLWCCLTTVGVAASNVFAGVVLFVATPTGSMPGVAAVAGGLALAGVLGGMLIGLLQGAPLALVVRQTGWWPLASGASGMVVGPAFYWATLCHPPAAALLGLGGLLYGQLTAFVLAYDARADALIGEMGEVALH